MKLTVIATGSAGNCYVLEGRRSALILECGVSPERMMQATTLKMSDVVGCLVTHEHGDHAGFTHRYIDLGLPVYASKGTCNALACGSRMRPVTPVGNIRLGEFSVFPFPVRHDAAEPMGFVIGHPELGRLLFVTDAAAIPYTFRDLGLDHIMIEANYSDRILDHAVGTGELSAERAQRVRNTHMSLEGAVDYVTKHEGPKLKTVVLVHLSSNNADRRAFQATMQGALMFAGAWVARPGLTLELNPTFETT